MYRTNSKQPRFHKQSGICVTSEKQVPIIVILLVSPNNSTSGSQNHAIGVGSSPRKLPENPGQTERTPFLW
jgi:hypothetical protein